MQKWVWGYAITVVTVGCIVVVQNVWGLSKSDWASWVQAVGSILAIAVAFLIANGQYRREEVRRSAAEELASYQLNAELSWLSGEVLDFLNQFTDLQVGPNDRITVSNDEVADVLERFAWCRQRVENKGQLAMLGTLRRSFVGTLRIVRKKEGFEPCIFAQAELSELQANRDEALAVFSRAVG